MLGFINAKGLEGFDDSKVEELENLILDCNSKMKNTYTDQVADSIYDTLYAMLKEVKPSSGILSEIWEDDGDITDYTDLLVKNPMMSIETAQSYECNELERFIDRMPDEASYFASYKINGHGIRVVYDNGVLVSATSRARSSAGKDLTSHMRKILGEENSLLSDKGIVELRGELCLKIENLSKAREFNPDIKSAFSAVASLIRPSSTDEELQLLDFLCYGMIIDDFMFEERDDEFQEIRNCGFSTPEEMYIESCRKADLLDTIKAAVNVFENYYEEFGYYCDGVVFEVSNRELFHSYGYEGNHNLGNIALKVGLWEQNNYCGYVQKILWERGKIKLSPVALVAEEPDMMIEDYDGTVLNMKDLGVLSASGNKLRRVPLYEPKNILILEAYPGNPLNFRYGDAGVVPCFPDGRLLKEDAAKSVVEEDEWIR